MADPAYEDDVDDDATDVGIKCGKLRISDRIGGMVRPKMVEEVCPRFSLVSKSKTKCQL